MPIKESSKQYAIIMENYDQLIESHKAIQDCIDEIGEATVINVHSHLLERNFELSEFKNIKDSIRYMKEYIDKIESICKKLGK